jgi:cation:H+ antiporter
MLWLRFAVSATIIIFSAMNLSRNADIIAEKTGLGRAWVGALLLPMVTSLPEIVASSQAALLGNPDISMGNVFGSNMFNITIIALVDLVQGGGPVLYYVSRSHILTASIGILLTGLTCLAILVGPNIVIPVLGIGVDTLILILVFLGGIRLITRYQRRNGEAEGGAEPQYNESSHLRAWLMFLLSGVLIVFAGRQLAISADALSQVTGLGGTFMGSFFVAITTSLPELVATVTAARMGAFDMAIGNVLGANVMNIFIIGVSDLFYRQGAMLRAVSQTSLVAGLLAMTLTGIAIIGLIYRSQRSVLRLGFDSIAIVALYILGALAIFSAAGSL